MNVKYDLQLARDINKNKSKKFEVIMEFNYSLMAVFVSIKLQINLNLLTNNCQRYLSFVTNGDFVIVHRTKNELISKLCFIPSSLKQPDDDLDVLPIFTIYVLHSHDSFTNNFFFEYFLIS